MSGSSNLARGSHGGLFIKTLATGEVDEVVSFDTDPGSDGQYLTWSPDGSRIAFDSYDPALVPGDTNGASDVFIVSVDSGAVVRASVDSEGRQAGNRSDSWMPAWSPDGTQLAFASDQLDPADVDLFQDIYIKDLARGAVQKISNGHYIAVEPAWSPDGRRIAWDEYGIQVRDLATGNTVTVDADSDTSMPAWSPDGTRLAYLAYLSTDKSRIYVTEPDPGKGQRREMVAMEGISAFHPRWSPDGSSILFSAAGALGNPLGQLYVKDLNAGTIALLSTNSQGKRGNNGSWSGAWSPDGKRIAFVSWAPNMVPCHTAGEGPQVFVKTLP